MDSISPKLSLIVMLVDNESARASIVEQVMLDNVYKVIRKLINTQHLTKAIQESLPDIYCDY
ncbi:hypothetical protein [Marinomonas sp. 2405UD68-3]|uniref:hypothetical protein n=1 Tax=Marinomonas sp. 2405UD68-3 TaxID=3391835 RepID=UPI0039C8FAA8